MRKTTYTLLPCFLLLLLSAACAPVHRFTRVKKVPREYSLNYRGSEAKAPRSDLNKEPWIVFSDREKNQAFINPGGKVKAKDVDFLDAFLVTGKKGEFLKLVKYAPDILKNGKLQYKQAEYYGWIDKSKLLLNRQSYTDISTGKKHKAIVAFSDTLLLDKPDTCLGTDSLLTFKDLTASSVNSGVAPFSLVYRLKESTGKEQTLIAKKAYIKAEEVKDDVLGWIDNSLLQDIGTGLHVDLPKAQKDSVDFIIRKNYAKSHLSPMHIFENRLLSNLHPAAKYSPVSLYSHTGSLTSYRVGLPLPVFDRSDNFVININGGNISYRDFSKIADNLKKINVAFVFEGQEQTIEWLPKIINALQSLQSVFDETAGEYTYNFSCVTNFFDAKERSNPHTPVMNIALQPEYAAVINYLAEKAANQAYLRQLPSNRTWGALRLAASSFDAHKDAVNLIVVIGEKGLTGGSFEKRFYEQVANNNCRILAFQPYAGEDNSYNNFVLDMESLISHYSDAMLVTKGNLLTSPRQARRQNFYKDVSQEAGNSYRLDFPDNSITQGYILFPPKGERLSMSVLAGSIDTILRQIRTDNEDVIRHITKAFNESGNNRTKFDSLYLASYGMDRDKRPLKKALASFKETTPGWYFPSEILLLNDSAHAGMNYKLLASEQEMREIKEFIEALSAIRADYKYQAQAKKKSDRKPCNCPDDDLFFPEEEASHGQNDSFPPEYAGTRKARKHIYTSHIQTIRDNKLCKEKKKRLKKMTLAELQQHITGLPTSNPVLNSITAQAIRKKKLVTDRELDRLIGYYKDKLSELDKAEKVESGGQTYFWVGGQHLP